MVEHDKGGQSEIKVVDKRRFTSAGDVRHDAPPDEPRRPPPPPPPAQGRDTQAAARPGAAPGGRQAPTKAGPEFLQFIASLATTAMAALGVLPEAQSRGMRVDHQMARDYIEIIAMLQERTRGNLTKDEEAALQRLISELRMQFVEATRAAPKPPGAS